MSPSSTTTPLLPSLSFALAALSLFISCICFLFSVYHYFALCFINIIHWHIDQKGSSPYLFVFFALETGFPSRVFSTHLSLVMGMHFVVSHSGICHVCHMPILQYNVMSLLVQYCNIQFHHCQRDLTLWLKKLSC